MRKFIFFPLWKIEELEKKLESMEQKGYRLEKIKHSHYFYFKESKPKEMSYFLCYKAFRGKNMGNWDYALLSNHNANPVESKMCYYTMYRARESKENLSFLRKARLDYIKMKLLEKALTALSVIIIFAAIIFAAIVTQSSYKELYLCIPIIGICVYFTVYYFYGFFKQRKKCKECERDTFNNSSP